jgi:uncharacterized protein YbjT (DUF2867 family)
MSHIGLLRRHRGMRIAIIGGTGTLGRQVTTQLRDRGHEVRVLSRSAPGHRVDLRTGAGLEEGLRDCQAVVDASNDSSRNAAQLLVGGTRRLLAAEQAAGVTHHVGVSIVGCELVPMRYFRAKAVQEQVLEHGPVPWTIVRATQFHELAAATLASAGRWRLVPVPLVLLQTVAAAEVAAVVAGAAAGSPRRGRVVVAGPQVATAWAVARTWRRVTRSPAVLVPVWLPGRIGRMLRGGALTASNPDVRGTITFAAWLEAMRHRQEAAEGETAGEYRSAAQSG